MRAGGEGGVPSQPTCHPGGSGLRGGVDEGGTTGTGLQHGESRQSGLAVGLCLAPGIRPRHALIDSTGLKVYGADEWHVRKYGMGRGRRLTWRKLHLGVDETTKDIVVVDLTTSKVHDGRQLPEILNQIPGDIAQVSADKAYDSSACYEAILNRKATPTIPPRRRARLSQSPDPPRAARD